MSKKSESKFGGKDIALIILAIGIIYILATNLVTTFIALILFGIIIVVGLYFILPLLGIEGLIGLATLIGLSKKR